MLFIVRSLRNDNAQPPVRLRAGCRKIFGSAQHVGRFHDEERSMFQKRGGKRRTVKKNFNSGNRARSENTICRSAQDAARPFRQFAERADGLAKPCFTGDKTGRIASAEKRCIPVNSNRMSAHADMRK
ncbi:hypothetical protein [Rhodobium gokarnense]|uniref:Uncharacterized protein n=1 Tax=Rhodobium gokarnense TaxID=364296 RepID=A0ABT3H8N1_9HYPH|nr:hypothetical protein [Rhodobium gokarnense]MCW2306762.1 hypothetical protein [Rhodobium gokarnense]